MQLQSAISRHASGMRMNKYGATGYMMVLQYDGIHERVSILKLVAITTSIRHRKDRGMFTQGSDLRLRS